MTNFAPGAIRVFYFLRLTFTLNIIQEIMITCITNLKGGVGKTTTALYLYHTLGGSRLAVDLTTEHLIKPQPNRIKDIIPGTTRIGDLEKSLSGSRRPELIFLIRSILDKEIDNFLVDKILEKQEKINA